MILAFPYPLGMKGSKNLQFLLTHPTVTMEIPSCKKHFNSGAKISDKNVCTATPTPSLFVGDSYGLSKYNVKTGSFVEDSRGRWYVCLVVDKTKQVKSKGNTSIGIDLGLKDLATCSDGVKLKAPQIYRQYEQKLGIAQRARNKKRVKAIHAKIRNIRQNTLHQFSHKLVNKHAAIFVGNVNAKALARTKLAKSVLDASWTTLRTMLKYKCENASVWYKEVNEAYTTQTCSSCGSRCSSPKGRTGLGIREWQCMECGTFHDRDINSALNILALGHERLAVGIPVL